jgi:hypothetical protein
VRYALLCLAACGAVPAQIQDFQNRLAEYQKLHDRAKAGVSKLKPTPVPESIASHERQLAYRIRESREQAAPGNIFTLPGAAEFKRLIAQTMSGPEAAGIRQSLARSEPVQLKLRVNDPYPKGVPLQSTPATLLMNLPKLPAGYEYRIVGRDLVLLDVEANLIVDFVLNAMP